MVDSTFRSFIFNIQLQFVVLNGGERADICQGIQFYPSIEIRFILKNFRKSIQNVLITWCEDNTSRIWKETPFHDSNLDSLLEAVDSVSREKQKRKHKHASIKKAGNKLISRLSHLT